MLRCSAAVPLVALTDTSQSNQSWECMEENGYFPSRAPLTNAAEYVRMSTEHQQYSTENQSDAIHRYAESRGYRIVRSYSDAGRSGLNIAGRPGLSLITGTNETVVCRLRFNGLRSHVLCDRAFYSLVYLPSGARSLRLPRTPSGCSPSNPDSANTEDRCEAYANTKHGTPRDACTGSVDHFVLRDPYSFAFVSRRRKLSLAAWVWRSFSSPDWNSETCCLRTARS